MRGEEECSAVAQHEMQTTDFNEFPPAPFSSQEKGVWGMSSAQPEITERKLKT
jgi:hypothetical protein